MFWEGRLLFFCHFPYYAGLTQTVRFSEKLILNLQCRTRIQSTPVLNGPFAYNGDTLSPEDVKAIQELFTSSLDNKSKVLVKDMLLKLKQEDTSTIRIFHDLEFMDGLCGIALNKKILAVSRSEILQGFFVVLILREQCCPPCVSG